MKTIEDAQTFLREWDQWHNLLRREYFSNEDLSQIFSHYELRVQDLKGQIKRAYEVTRDEHNQRVAELTGTIGGLKKKINELTKEQRMAKRVKSDAP